MHKGLWVPQFIKCKGRKVAEPVPARVLAACTAARQRTGPSVPSRHSKLQPLIELWVRSGASPHQIRGATPSFPQSLDHLFSQLRPDAALFVLKVNKRFFPLGLFVLHKFRPAIDVRRLVILAS
jgi:hypothetical protein